MLVAKQTGGSEAGEVCGCCVMGMQSSLPHVRPEVVSRRREATFSVQIPKRENAELPRTRGRSRMRASDTSTLLTFPVHHTSPVAKPTSPCQGHDGVAPAYHNSHAIRPLVVRPLLTGGSRAPAAQTRLARAWVEYVHTPSASRSERRLSSARLIAESPLVRRPSRPRLAQSVCGP